MNKGIIIMQFMQFCKGTDYKLQRSKESLKCFPISKIKYSVDVNNSCATICNLFDDDPFV